MVGARNNGLGTWAIDNHNHWNENKMKRKEFLKLFGVVGASLPALPTIFKPKEPVKPDPVKAPPAVDITGQAKLTEVEYGFQYNVPRDRWQEFYDALHGDGKVKVEGEWWVVSSLETDSDSFAIDSPNNFGYQQYIQGRMRLIAHLHRTGPPRTLR